MKAERSGKPHTSTAAPSHAPDAAPTLPPWKAFVVQFSDESDAAAGIFSGRVEHLNSAHRARFESLEELVALLTKMLDEFAQR